jgi:RimJ/RimL family protein N-acetyltransferase
VTRRDLWPRRTERLELRLPTDADLDAVLAWRNAPAVTRWLLRTEVDPAQFKYAWRRGAEDPRDHSVVALADGVLVGTLSIEVVDGMGQGPQSPAQGSEGQLGYLVDPAQHSRGYATEMVRAGLDLAFGDLGLRRVTAGCFADNVASWRVMEKAGMRREQHGIRDSWHAELGWVDGFTYAVLTDEWPRGWLSVHQAATVATDRAWQAVAGARHPDRTGEAHRKGTDQ